MNQQITRVSLAAVLLIAALIVATTYWQTWASAGLKDRQDNAIQRVAQFSIERGKILASDGTVLARNKAKKVGGHTLYFRRYPHGSLAAHLVGYATQSRNATGIERGEDDYLTGANANLSSLWDSTLNRLKGETIKGNDIVLTLRTRAQQVANEQLAGKCGAVVALDPHTGAVLVMASAPTFNPNLVESNGGFASILRAKSPCGEASPLLNRATDGLFVPGSTFKIVTASAALDSGAVTPDTGFDDPGYCMEYGVKVRNAGNPEAPETFGHVSFFQAFQHSINSVFCNVGKQIGAGRILEEARKFGFYAVPPLETPLNERAPSGLYDPKKHVLFRPKNPATQVDPGRLAFGQEKMLVTPLQMAMVAATVANGGKVPQPYAVQRVISPSGKTVAKTGVHDLGQAIKTRTAQELTPMMVAVVNGGTAPAAAIPGIQVAGKTGTAETGVNGVNTTWFVAFAPADNPKVAVAVVLEKQLNGFGGTTAAPIAKAVMQAILGRG
ncbi:MAG: penicillin-binding protein [Gaiellaceae bacterium]|jgi:peptidoglycan glycosyltransferase|nr:penicillin-binding protein [Gaiellaceae bacterium]